MTELKNRFGLFQPLQRPGYEILKPDGTAVVDSLLPLVSGERGIDVPGWRVLDASKPDGIDVRRVKYADVPGGLANESGTILVAEREKGTRLFLLWVSRTAAAHLKAEAFHNVNLHLIFHTPPFDCYTSTSYWTGTCTIDGKDNACRTLGLKDERPYLQLGSRYLCTDFRIVAQHLLAVARREPNVIYVVPVADGAYFNDLLTGDALTRLFQDVVLFAAQQVAGSTKIAGFPEFGNVMLSGYSRSGDRIEELMKGVSGTPFFRRHLSQLNLFDPNLHEKPAVRKDRFAKMIGTIARWKNDINRAARVFVYTALPDHLEVLKTALRLGPQTDVDLDAVTWSDPGRKGAVGGRRRGHGIEAYNHDASVGAAHLPIDFFALWLPEPGLLPNPAGFDHAARGNFHGHGWFLRTLMAHALAHADPSWYGAARV